MSPWQDLAGVWMWYGFQWDSRHLLCSPQSLHHMPAPALFWAHQCLLVCTQCTQHEASYWCCWQCEHAELLETNKATARFRGSGQHAWITEANGEHSYVSHSCAALHAH